MSRDGLPRAYLRIDPNLDQHYPELRSTFVGLLCAAGRQPDRGRFRDRRLVEQLCGRAFVSKSYARGDLVDSADGHAYVVGWDEWQEGDMTVAERMKRMRDRRRNRVTAPPSPRRNGVTTDAGSTNSSLVSTSGVGVGADSPPPPARRGKRSEATNLRATGDSPRQTGTNSRSTGESPRQEREAQKRGPVHLSAAVLDLIRGNGA